MLFGPVAQWLEPAAHNGLVAGSSPAGPTISKMKAAHLAPQRGGSLFVSSSASFAALDFADEAETPLPRYAWPDRPVLVRFRARRLWARLDDGGA